MSVANILNIKPMNKIIKSTLDSTKDYNLRRKGHTTRQVDLAIQLLFEGYNVQVLDHFEEGNSDNANEYLLKRILDRMAHEHPAALLSLVVDRKTMIIHIDQNVIEHFVGKDGKTPKE